MVFDKYALIIKYDDGNAVLLILHADCRCRLWIRLARNHGLTLVDLTVDSPVCDCILQK